MKYWEMWKAEGFEDYKSKACNSKRKKNQVVIIGCLTMEIN